MGLSFQDPALDHKNYHKHGDGYHLQLLYGIALEGKRHSFNNCNNDN